MGICLADGTSGDWLARCANRLADEVSGGATLGIWSFDASCLARLYAAQDPGHVVGEVAHGAQTFLVLDGLAGRAPMDVVPVRGGHDRHLVDGEVLVEHVERRGGAAAAGDGDGGSGLVAEGVLARIEGAVEGAQDAARRMRLIDGRAKDEGV